MVDLEFGVLMLAGVSGLFNKLSGFFCYFSTNFDFNSLLRGVVVCVKGLMVLLLILGLIGALRGVTDFSTFLFTNITDSNLFAVEGFFKLFWIELFIEVLAFVFVFVLVLECVDTRESLLTFDLESNPLRKEFMLFFATLLVGVVVLLEVELVFGRDLFVEVISLVWLIEFVFGFLGSFG